MSLIFQSLQKLDANSGANASEEENPASGQDQPRKRLVRWLLPVVIGLVLVLALGCGAVYAIQYLKDRLPERGVPGPVGEERVPEAGTVAYHPAVPGDETAAEVPGRREAVLGAERVSVSRFQYHPPETGKSTATQEPAGVEAESSAEPSNIRAAIPTTPLLSEPPHPSKTPVLNKAESVQTKPPPVVDKELEAVERARRKALEKSARIARLVRQIESALTGSPGSGDTIGLLNQLARIKGEHHPYVAKLRAYYNFQRGSYALAEADLHQVIAANPEDLEAGINLALIEIIDQRYPEALARLKKLRRSYPENAQIADLIKRLR